MIVLDTSAVMAILNNEEGRARCEEVIVAGGTILISAGTLAELMVVAGRRNLVAAAVQLIENLDIRIVDVTLEVAYRIGETYRRWGKGFHPAGLNFGDCFAYEAAKSRNCPLLYVGNDFSRTDVLPAVAPA